MRKSNLRVDPTKRGLWPIGKNTSSHREKMWCKQYTASARARHATFFSCVFPTPCLLFPGHYLHKHPAAAVVDRTCACSASCSGLTARATALLQMSTLLPISFSAIASIFSGGICCAKLALAAAKAGSSGCMLAKKASTLLICLCTLIASAGFALIAQANWWVACPQSCVDCNSDAMFWTCFEMARPLSSTGVVEPDRVPEFRGRVHADLGWLSCLSRFSNAWRYDFFTPQLRHFFRPLQFPVLQWLQLHSRHSPERQDCHSLSDHADCRVAMLFQSYLVTRAKRKLS